MALNINKFCNLSNISLRNQMTLRGKVPVKRSLLYITTRNQMTLKRIVPVKQSVFHFTRNSSTNIGSGLSRFSKFALIIGGLSVGGGLYGYLASPNKKARTQAQALTEKTDYTINYDIPDIKPSRQISGPAADLGLELTLYQYQTCPFCCKVRAFLEFYGIPYNVIEVNPVMRQQIKFSKYKKVPILIAQERDSEVKHQLNDSSVIVSILGTLLLDIKSGLSKVLPYYVPLVYKDDDGKEITDVMNKYSLMYGDKTPKDKSDDYLKMEKEWRKWADDEFVHILSPNIYRTYDEALQAFNYFSEVGEWEKNFSTLERLVVIYVGATAMYFIGKRLKKK
ncbi:Prostaglandin E synthase 2, partial [Stegodyphus mimosarum]